MLSHKSNHNNWQECSAFKITMTISYLLSTSLCLVSLENVSKFQPTLLHKQTERSNMVILVKLKCFVLLFVATPEIEMLRAALTSSGKTTFSGSLGSVGFLRGKRQRGSHMPSSSSVGVSGDGTDSNTSGLNSPPCALGSCCSHGKWALHTLAAYTIPWYSFKRYQHDQP